MNDVATKLTAHPRHLGSCRIGFEPKNAYQVVRISVRVVGRNMKVTKT